MTIMAKHYSKTLSQIETILRAKDLEALKNVKELNSRTDLQDKEAFFEEQSEILWYCWKALKAVDTLKEIPSDWLS
jgi:hypothetical protein